MADHKKSNRKPLSLNDHYRLLQELSAPPKHPPSSLTSNEEEVKPSIVKPEGRHRLGKASDRGTMDDDVPKFSGIADFDSPPAAEKPTKVKIQGRRRLCKVLSRDDEEAEDRVSVDEGPSFSGITDFDSPVPSKTAGVSGNDSGVSEIMDILNDLSARLDHMSIQKERVPKSVDKGDDDVLGLVGSGEKDKHVDIPEYASAGSSFSHASEPSDALSDVKNVGGVKDTLLDEDEESGNLFCESRSEYFFNEVPKININDRGLTKDDNLVSTGKSSAYNVEDIIALCSDSEDDNYVSEVQKCTKDSQRIRKNEPKIVNERLRYAGRSFTSVLRDEEEDDDEDCVIHNSKRKVKKSVTCVGKHESSDSSNATDLLEDLTDEPLVGEEVSIKLVGPKSTYELPVEIAKMLYPHQREGLRWLWSLHCMGKGGILGDDMGLGKTMQICGFLAGLFRSKLIKRVMVVAPKTLLSHWIKELSAVGLSRKIREYFGTSVKTRQFELQYILQDKGVLLTTYDIVRNNSKSLRGDGYFDYDDIGDEFIWDYMILDEGHIIKNPSTQRAKSLLEIPSAHRIVISGTPIQNNLKELWALFNFCCPDLLGDYKSFKEKYEQKILRGNEKNASEREKRVGSTVAKELRERIQPYFLRRLKNEVFKEDDATTVKLSKKNEIIVWLKLTSCQRQLYEAFLQSELVLSAFDGSPLAALTILKKICDHPLLLTKRAAEDVLEGMDSLLKPEDAGMAEKLAMHIADVAERTDFQENHDNVSCKISFILSLLDNLITEGHNVLIFSQTRKMLNLIQESLVSNGYQFLRIDGTTKASDRVKIVNDFQEGNGTRIFLLTSQVGGLGLTLTNADRVIVVDPAWNPSTDNQSVDRAYRIGQKKDVIVYRLMTCGTVEEKIYRKQIFKGGLFKSATEHKEQIRYFSQQDLRELFSLPKHGFDVSLTQQQLHEEHDSQHKMDEFLEAHIQFLETQGIAGVSHHSLLFSKTAPVQVVENEEEEIRNTARVFVGNSSRSTADERNVEGALYAVNPKDVKQNKKSSTPNSSGKLTESEIKDKINRLSQMLANKGMVSKLPDRGAKLQSQISELNLELEKLKGGKRSEEEVISLDDLTKDLQRVLNV